VREELLYLDSSALVKLVLPEPETGVLLELIADWPERISSWLARVEVLRAVQRAGEDGDVHRRAEEVVSRVGLLRIDAKILNAAARLEPSELRTLDAIHLATALSVGGHLGGVVTYDSRLAQAAECHGVSVLAPTV
jgi:predicted nucleic acid-binding protein